MRRFALVAATCASLALSGWVPPARAERADRDKPMQIEADHMTSDEARRVTIFDGNVVVTQGTITVRADRIVVRQDQDQLRHITATGNPVRFRERADAAGGRPGTWIEGQARRVEIDERDEKVDLFDDARVTRDGDEVRGEHIALDQRAESFSVSGGAQAPDGRVRAVIQPKPQPPAK
ncbi:MAG TPA: lipopolysaccharide transport periplasmic protein LptA [Burkholderiales bacterium]|nr:lipopolysaccharide transport periplasmic protein LptA [Burkholderiales bacterium]